MWKAAKRSVCLLACFTAGAEPWPGLALGGGPEKASFEPEALLPSPIPPMFSVAASLGVTIELDAI